jgi:hypothetical protein
MTELTLRLDGRVVQILNEEADRRSAETRGPKWTRADVIRDIILEWVEKRDKPAKK